MTETSQNALQSTESGFQHPTLHLGGADASQGNSDLAVYGKATGRIAPGELRSKNIGRECKCNLPSCRRAFPQRNPSTPERFCCAAHKDEFWKMARKIGEQVMMGELAVTGVSQSKSVLAILRKSAGRFVNLKAVLPFIIARDAVAKLRRRGHVIDTRREWNDEFRRTVFRYRLSKDAEVQQ